MIENPPLNEDLLIHFGVKGMKWGRRKKRPDEAERKKTFQNAERNRKIKIGLAVVAGAAVVGTLMSSRGRTAVTNFSVTQYVQGRSAKSTSAKNPVNDIVRRFKDVKASSVPTPNAMMADARMAGVRNAVDRAGAQRLTDKTWRDAANLRRQAGSIPSSQEIARRLNDPNYVWEL